MMPFAPIRKGGSVSCLVYHFLPALDAFRHESPRKCAETPRKCKSCRAHPQKQKTARLAVTGRFSASIGIMRMAYFQSASSAPALYHQRRKSRAFLHEFPKNDTKCLLPGGIAAENARQRKMGLLHHTVQQSLRGYKGSLPVSGLSRASGSSSKCG